MEDSSNPLKHTDRSKALEKAMEKIHEKLDRLLVDKDSLERMPEQQNRSDRSRSPEQQNIYQIDQDHSIIMSQKITQVQLV